MQRASSSGSLLRSGTQGSLMSMGSLGRFIHKDPLSGYSEQELVAEAKIRIEANRQRRRMKQLMAAASDDGFNVLTKDLLLAAKLAKVQLPDELIAETPYAAGLDVYGVPTKIAWKPFYGTLPPPALKGPGSFGALPPLRRNRTAEKVETKQAVKVVKTEEQADPEEVAYWFGMIQNKMKDKFAEVRRAFRSLDADASGQLDMNEFKSMLIMFNLGTVPDIVINAIYKMTDFDGSGTISYAEFARLVTTEDVNNMKNTISALESDAVAAKVRREMKEGGSANIDKELGINVKLRRTGPGLAKMRRFHATLREILSAEFGEGEKGMKACYAAMDADSSGLVRRGEMRTFMRKRARMVPDDVISGLIDYVDTDGDVKTLSLSEWLKIMSSDFLQ